MNSTMSLANILYAHDFNHFNVDFHKRKFASHSENDKETYLNSAGTLVAGKALPVAVSLESSQTSFAKQIGCLYYFLYTEMLQLYTNSADIFLQFLIEVCQKYHIFFQVTSS